MTVFTKHFIDRVKERFPEVVEELGVCDLLDTIENLSKSGELETHYVSSGVVMFHLNFRIYEDDHKFKTHKMAVVAREDLTAMITVLTDKMVRDTMSFSKKKKEEPKKKVRFYHREKYYA